MLVRWKEIPSIDSLDLVGETTGEILGILAVMFLWTSLWYSCDTLAIFLSFLSSENLPIVSQSPRAEKERNTKSRLLDSDDPSNRPQMFWARWISLNA